MIGNYDRDTTIKDILEKQGVKDSLAGKTIFTGESLPQIDQSLFNTIARGLVKQIDRPELVDLDNKTIDASGIAELTIGQLLSIENLDDKRLGFLLDLLRRLAVEPFSPDKLRLLSNPDLVKQRFIDSENDYLHLPKYIFEILYEDKNLRWGNHVHYRRLSAYKLAGLSLHDLKEKLRPAFAKSGANNVEEKIERAVKAIQDALQMLAGERLAEERQMRETSS